MAISNTIGGQLANIDPLNSLRKMFGFLVAALLFLFIAIEINNSILGLVATLLLGLFAFMNVPGLQLYVVELAEKLVPQDITLASSFNIAAFNVGIAIGSTIGAQVTGKLAISYTPLFGAGIVLLAIILIFRENKKKSTSQLEKIMNCEA